MDFKAIQLAIKQLSLEKNLSEDIIQDTLNVALAAAYRKDYGDKNQNVTFKMDPKTGEMEVWDMKTVVDYEPEILDLIKQNGLDKKYVHGKTLEETAMTESGNVRQKSEDELERELSALGEEIIKYNPKTDILLEEAVKISAKGGSASGGKKSYKVGDQIITELPIPTDFGRMAAQTAKQVIIQKIREAEKNAIYDEFKDRVGEVMNAYVQRREGRNVLIDLGKATGIMPPEQQVWGERYNPSDRLKVLLLSVELGNRGPEIIFSRSHPTFLQKLFEAEIPEMGTGMIEIVSIAREAGQRSKVAVKSNDKSIDPIGSCVGQRGSRIQTIIGELNGEKIDIIEYSENIEKYISNSLSPAKASGVKILTGDKDTPGNATVIVPEDQLSLAIGREGQNVRLAAKLTGWKINIQKEGDAQIVFNADEINADQNTQIATDTQISTDGETKSTEEVTSEVAEIEKELQEAGKGMKDGKDNVAE